MATRRQRRIDKKYKGSLICEACGRWTAVHLDDWREAIKGLRERHQPYLCLCNRDACKRSRPEGLLSTLRERDKDKIIYA